MRILCLSTEFPPGPGGIGAHALHVSRQLHQRGCELLVLSPQDYARRREIETFNHSLPFPIVRLPHLPGPLFQGAWWALKLHRAAVRHRAELILATGQRAVWLASAYGALRRLPLAAVGHGTEFGVRRSWERFLNTRAYRRSELVISVSEFTEGYMSEAGIHPAASVVIPNGADGKFFRPPTAEEVTDLLTRFPFTSDRLLVTVGTLGERKGQDLVIRALPRLLEEIPDVRYAMIGLADAAPRLLELARELGVEERVHCLGRLPNQDVRALVGAADLFVLPSRCTDSGDVEGFGIAVVEAALCGTPAVVSRAGGLVEAIHEGETGLAVPAEDPDQLAVALLELLRDDRRRLAMAERARERATVEQTWRRRGAQYHQELLALLGRSDGSPSQASNETPSISG